MCCYLWAKKSTNKITILGGTVLKLKALSIATLAALYTTGVNAAATSQGWQAIDLSADVVQQRNNINNEKRAQFDSLNPKFQSNAVNRVIKHKTAEEKFTPEADVTGEHVYIIQLNDAPVATYMGGVNNIPATALGNNANHSKNAKVSSAANSQKLFSNSQATSAHIEQYRDHLRNEQHALVSEAKSLGVPLVVAQEFTVTLNAITAKLTQKQAAQLANSSRVSHIQRSIVHEIASDLGPQVIKADKVWTGEGTHTGLPYKGEGQVVAIIDTGINTDHISFADIGGDGYDHTNPLGKGVYLGECQQEEFADRCNDKLIGVYTWDVISDMYSAEYFQPGYPNHSPWNTEQIRPRFGEDYHGHGSHVAGTAAGNVVIDAPLQLPSFDADPETLGNVGDGRDTGYTTRVSGVAPHANVIMYQACWGGDGVTNPYYGCPTEATLASIEQAVLDGVDVINYSISGDGFPWEAAIQQAFFSAYAAGISVAAAAGNGGFQSPTAHNSPWLLNVAATHHGRDFGVEPKTLDQFSGGDTPAPSAIQGASISEGFTGALVNAADFGDQTCDTPFAENTFTADQIVVCERSDQPRMTKADNLVAAGAGGFILYNKDSWGDYATLVTDMYPLPSIHITRNDGQALLEWMASGSDHTATISAAEAFATVDETRQNLIASFTSAKENQKFDGTLTPSIGAPGVQVFAAWSDDQPFTGFPSAADWNVIDGTSMASPHIAGALALIRQARPEWSVAQVQSAAQMTANGDMNDGSGGDPYARSGSGLINVAAAINSGLIMDETAHNMQMANPKNGGDPTNLNLPTLVNTSCETECSWIRTVTATKDGTWTVEGTPNHDAVSIDISASPSTFSLKAGESQAIIVTAKILDAVTDNSSPELSYLFGDVKLKAQEADIPDAHWPMKIKFSRNDLPQILRVEAHRDNGQFTIKDLPVSRLAELNGQAFQVATATPLEVDLPQDSDSVSPYWDTDLDGAEVHWVDVPMGTKRLFAETLKELSTTAPKNSGEQGDLDILIGQDINNDGEINFQEETICWSYSDTELDFCSISDPAPGKYWVVYHNYKSGFTGEWSDSYQVAHGIVSSQEASNITVSTDTVIDESTHSIDVDVKWDITNWQQGDRVYSSIDLGSSADDAGNIGTIPLNITRGANDIEIKSTQDQAQPGDNIAFSVAVLENNTGADRNFEIKAKIPAGMKLVDNSVMIDNKRHTGAEIEVLDGEIIIRGTQVDSTNWARTYNITTNAMDQSCRMPLSPDGGYINLADMGFQPSFGGHYSERSRFSFRDFFQAEDHKFALYENDEAMPYNSINISPQGWVQFDGGELFWPDHYPFASEYLSFLGGRPDTMIAPLFRGSVFDGSIGTPLNLVPEWEVNAESTGITMVYNDNPKALLIEWDNATTETPMYDWETGEESWVSWGDSYDFQTYINLEYQYGDNQHEIVMAYDNVNFAEEVNLPVQPWLLGTNDASIGVYGFHGPRGTFGPTYGGLGNQFHFGDVSEVLTNDLLVCYDYVGPEATQFNVSFAVQVDNNATGTDMDVVVESMVDGIESTSQTFTVASPSNISVVAINDVEMIEDTTVSGIEVVYHDLDKNSNVISVSGENITATVNGHDSGSTFSITPDANFAGETMVTVTVADKFFPSDKKSTQFKLTVLPVEDAPVAAATISAEAVTEGDAITLSAVNSVDVDSDALTYSWQGPGTIADSTAMETSVSGLSVGTHTFTLTVSDGVHSDSSEVSVTVSAKDVPVPPTTSKKSSSSSLFYMTLLLGLVAPFRRKFK